MPAHALFDQRIAAIQRIQLRQVKLLLLGYEGDSSRVGTKVNRLGRIETTPGRYCQVRVNGRIQRLGRPNCEKFQGILPKMPENRGRIRGNSIASEERLPRVNFYADRRLSPPL